MHMLLITCPFQTTVFPVLTFSFTLTWKLSSPSLIIASGTQQVINKCDLHEWKNQYVCLNVYWIRTKSETPWTIQSMEFSRPKDWRGSSFLLQGISPTQGSNPGLPHCRWILYQLSHLPSHVLNILHALSFIILANSLNLGIFIFTIF